MKVKKKDIDIKKIVPWIIYLIFFAVLNETVFNVSTPIIADRFSLSPSGVSWMMTIFMVFFGVGSVIYGKLSDIFSLRLLIIIGIVIYNIGSVSGFALQFSYPLVIASRAIQGIGASAIPALIFVVISRYFPDSQRGRIFGIIASTVSLGIGLGPVIGGFVSRTFGWSYLFLISLLILISVPFLSRELPPEKRKAGKVDLPGALLIALTVGTMILYLNFNVWYYLAAFAALLSLFIMRIRTAPDPFIKPSLFKNTRFRNGMISAFCLFSVVIGTLFLIPLMLNKIYGLNTGEIGLILFPGAMSSVIFGPIGGTIADRRGNSFVVAIGLALLFISLILMAFMLSISVLVIASALLLTYVGFSLFQTAMINGVSQTLPGDETGIGMGLFNLAGIISGAFGTALAGKILDGGNDFIFVSLPVPPKTYLYSSVMLIFSMIVLAGGILYLWSYRKAGVKAKVEVICQDCDL